MTERRVGKKNRICTEEGNCRIMIETWIIVYK